MNSKRLLLGAACFYVVLAPFFFHPDLKIIYQLAGFLGQGVVNIYDYYVTYPEQFHLGPFVYPPVAYFLLGGLYPLVKIIAGSGFAAWLNMGNDAVDLPTIYRYLLAIKLPLIAAHLFIGWLLGQLVTVKTKTHVMALWLFNPISIYVVGLMGQIDIFAAVSVAAALYFASRKSTLGAVSLGLGAALKAYPLLFLPFYVLLVGRTWTERIKLALIGGGAYALCIAPFIGSSAFWEQTLASGLSQRLLTINISGVPIVPVILTALVGLVIKKDLGQTKKLVDYLLLAGLVVLAAIKFHPQWAMWVLPMACLYIIRTKNIWLGMALLAGWVLALFTFADRFLTWGLISPIEKAALFLPPPVALLSPTIVSWLTIGHILLLGLCAMNVIWRLFKDKHEVS